MYRILAILLVAASCFAACSKDEVADLNVEGYWLVQRDTTFTATAANASADLFHLFKNPNVFLRYSFPKGFNFADAALKPRSDSMITYFKTEGEMLLLPNPAPSATNTQPGNVLLEKTDNRMVFTRSYVTSRNSAGQPATWRVDTITYNKVTDAATIAYFDKKVKYYY